MEFCKGFSMVWWEVFRLFSFSWYEVGEFFGYISLVSPCIIIFLLVMRWRKPINQHQGRW
jgi:hypothetical protein